MSKSCTEHICIYNDCPQCYEMACIDCNIKEKCKRCCKYNCKKCGGYKEVK